MMSARTVTYAKFTAGLLVMGVGILGCSSVKSVLNRSGDDTSFQPTSVDAKSNTNTSSGQQLSGNALLAHQTKVLEAIVESSDVERARAWCKSGDDDESRELLATVRPDACVAFDQMSAPLIAGMDCTQYAEKRTFFIWGKTARPEMKKASLPRDTECKAEIKKRKLVKLDEWAKANEDNGQLQRLCMGETSSDNVFNFIQRGVVCQVYVERAYPALTSATCETWRQETTTALGQIKVNAESRAVLQVGAKKRRRM